MANPKITFPELPVAAALTGSELVPVWQTSGVVKATLTQVVMFAGGLINTIALDQGGGLVAGGTATALTVTPNQGAWALVDGANIAFRAGITNTGAATLNVNGTGARSLVKGSGQALGAGDLVAGHVYEAVYVAASTHFRLRAGVIGAAPAAVTILSTAGSGNYATPAGARRLRITEMGGGGAGGGSTATSTGEGSAGGGGNSGTMQEFTIDNPSGNYAWIVGAAGVGGAAAIGGDGGDTSFNGVVANGGKGGAVGGNGSGTGFLAAQANPLPTPPGAGSIRVSGGWQGGPWMRAATNFVSGSGGASPFGTGGAGSSTALATGNAATGNGAGGGGSCRGASSAASTGGAGSPGIIIVEAIF